MTPTDKYAAPLRLLHWVMAAAILASLATGWVMEDASEAGRGALALQATHHSLGVLLLAMLMVRIATRLATGVPALPETLSEIERRAAKAAHWLLYALMALVPLSGYLLAATSEAGASAFGLALPSPIGGGEALHETFEEIHETLANLLIALVALHVAAALKHRFLDGKESGVLARMT
jgi:cytochrome b561